MCSEMIHFLMHVGLMPDGYTVFVIVYYENYESHL